MTDPATGQRSFLQALKVPFDLKGIGVGMLAYVALVLGGRALEIRDDPWEVLRDISRGGSPAWDDRTSLAVLSLYLGVAALFGVACSRIAAMRLSRDEGVGLTDSLAFAAKSLPSTLGAFLFMAAAIALFYVCNSLAGLACGIPGAGPFLAWVLYPLVLLSTVLLFLLAFGTAFGLPYVLPALAVERNGALDAVSRAFSYVFGRPVLFFFYGATVVFVAAVLLRCAGALGEMASASFTRMFPADSEGYRGVRSALLAAGSAAPLRLPDFDGILGFGKIEGAARVGGWAFWAWGTLFRTALLGWVVYYFFGGFTAAYFALRRDVDGTEDEEIWIEGEDQGSFGEPEKPTPAAGPATDAKPSSAQGATEGRPPSGPPPGKA